MGRPKTEKPADPILAAVMSSEPASMPALSSPEASLGDNALVITEELARGVQQLRFLDEQLAAINLQKSGVFATLGAKGYNKKRVKSADKNLRIDPVLRAQIEEADRAYVRALEAGLARLKAEAEAAEKAASAEAKAAA